uniref:Bifunctional N-acetylglucosamine-1-phosphate uridyltransferase/glucosamine-1-phosphate acetyltransferase n=1 Tax=candidate division WOR-3 bacterium TaxID=2052148 RepID=A0A7C4UH14_UNCW3
MKLCVVIMAGGIGKRMKSRKVKVLHNILEKPLIYYVVELAKSLSPERVVIVYGKNGEMIKEIFEDVHYAYQEEPLGTGDAVKRGLEKLKDFDGDILILSGDVILLRKETIMELIEEHIKKNADCTILTFKPENPSHYGRIVRDKEEILKIVEARDASPEELEIKEVNSGVYIFKKYALSRNIEKIDNKNAQGEYYLTDVISKIKDDNGKIYGVLCKDPSEVEGINTREELANVERIMLKRLIKKFQDEGVTFHLPETIFLGWDVKIGRDSEIYPFNTIIGKTEIGEGCIVEPFCYLKNAKIPDGTFLRRGTIIEG